MPQANFRVEALIEEYAAGDACAATLLCDRHNHADIAFTIIQPDLSSEDITYGQLRERSEQGAAALARLGIGPGDCVATLMGKSADFVVMLLAIWRLGAVHVPLFTAFAWPAIELRLTASNAKLVITDHEQRDKIQNIPATVLVAGHQAVSPDVALAPLLESHESQVPNVAVGPEGALVLIFTSGTTGTPKGVPVPLRALAAFHEYMDLGLDVVQEDVFWNAADPGWAYGLYYGILGPLAAGRRSLLLNAGFSPALCLQVMERFGVTNFAAAPTVYRTIRSKAEALPSNLRLRRASSAGEPLTPEVIAWSEETFGVPVRDHYGQTEHGMVIINAWHDEVRKELRQGSMGQPMPGWVCQVLKDSADEPAEPGHSGRVAIDVPNSPMLWFDGYQDAPDRTAQRYSPDGRWYLTGDAGMRDDDGYFFFSARDDDVIIMSGYRIGPFEIESVLAAHPAVLESAVIGTPDELRGEVVEAYVVLAENVPGDDALASELQQFVKSRFAAHAFPRRIHFVEALPKTPSGKVQRYVLRRERAQLGEQADQLP